MPEEKNVVVLLHGLCRTPRSMRPLEKALRKASFTTANIGYPSRSRGMESLARDHLAPALQQLRQTGVTRFHFVTHSMGGILLREYLRTHSETNVGHVVMIAPPNQGSALAEKFHRFLVFRMFNGPAGQDLGTTPQSAPNRLGPIRVSCGIIAGNRPIYPFFARYLDGENDGIVSVGTTHLEGETDHLVLPYGHTRICNAHEVHRQVIHFLHNGRFQTKTVTRRGHA